MKLPSKLDPESVVVTVDSREQMPLSLEPLSVVTGCLHTGDYALAACPQLAVIERKSLSDLLCCCGSERERFEKELVRMLAYPVRVLLVESTWAEIEMGQWRSKLTPAQVQGSLIGWAAMGIQVELVGSHERAGRFAAKLLYIIANRQYRQLRGMFSEAGQKQEASE